MADVYQPLWNASSGTLPPAPIILAYNASVPSINGTGIPTALVQLKIDGVSYSSVSTVASDGTWTLLLSTALNTTSAHTVTATQTLPTQSNSSSGVTIGSGSGTSIFTLTDPTGTSLLLTRAGVLSQVFISNIFEIPAVETVSDIPTGYGVLLSRNSVLSSFPIANLGMS